MTLHLKIIDGFFFSLRKIDFPNLLTASHIKPWIKSDNNEKIDPKNGFIFSPTYDRLFDRGYITFTDKGILKISDWLPKSNTLTE